MRWLIIPTSLIAAWMAVIGTVAYHQGYQAGRKAPNFEIKMYSAGELLSIEPLGPGIGHGPLVDVCPCDDKLMLPVPLIRQPYREHPSFGPF